MRERGAPPSAGTAHGQRGLADLAGLAPAMALFSVFIVVPMLGAIALSLFRWNGLGTPHWAGGANWVQFARDPLARQALTVTAKVVGVQLGGADARSRMALGLFTAGRQRYRSVYATLYVLPLLLSTAGIALMWEACSTRTSAASPPCPGPCNLGFLRQNWLGTPVHHAVRDHRASSPGSSSRSTRCCTRWAAGRSRTCCTRRRALDGASRAQVFWRVTLPQLRYTIVTSSTLIIVGSLTYFDIVYIMTNGGPGYTTRVLSLDMYQAAFQQNEFGYASVLAVVLGVVGVGIALGLVRFSGFGSMASQQEGAA